MNQQEQKTVDQLLSLVTQLRTENAEFRNQIGDWVTNTTAKVDAKHMPVNLEQDVFRSVQASISKALGEAMTGYNSPLVLFAKNIVNRHQTQIEAIFDQIVKEGIQTPEFQQSVRTSFLNKIAKTVVSGVDGGVDKTINQMKSDPVFRSRLTLVVNGLIEEFLAK